MKKGKADILTSKVEIARLLAEVCALYNASSHALFVKKIHTSLLKKKVRFPLLEYAAREVYKLVPDGNQVDVCDRMIDLKEIGSNVLAGIILQCRLSEHAEEAHQKAIAYIIQGDEWYVCDIIGERVMGHALLTQPEKTIPLLETDTKHLNKWIVRSVGVATHYAVKKGLRKVHVDTMFKLLLTCSATTDFHTKKGIGWTVKTISKFHPDIIQKYKEEIDTDTNIKQWFKTKIKIGLSRTDKYVARYSG